MDIRFRPEKRDIVAALRQHGFGMRPLVWVSLAMCVMMLVGLVAAALSKETSVMSMWKSSYQVFIIAGFFIALWKWSEYSAWRNLRCTFQSWKFGEQEILFETETSSAQLKWASFLYYKEGKKIFLLYQQKRMFNFIPKRVLSSNEVDEFRALLALHLPKK